MNNMWVDHDLWKMFGSLMAIATFIYVWAKKGATPLFFASLLLAMLDAGLRQAASTVAMAARHYWTNYPATLRQVRAELMERVK